MKATVHKTFASITRHHFNGATSRAALELNPAGETVTLRERQHMHIHGAAGWTIRALGGAVWITQDHDIRDVVLETGQSFTTDRAGEVLLSPLGEARVCITRGVACEKSGRPAPALSLAGTNAAFA